MYKPHIIIGTEIWLSNETCDNEIIPDGWNYVIYRNDRPDGYGGIMIAISKQLTSSKTSSLQTDCEVLWTQIICWRLLQATYIRSVFYRPA